LANFSEHIQQSKNNLDFLSQLNKLLNNRWDWQVTTCFYSAVHLINAHIAQKTNKNYLSHSKVSEIINPYTQLSLAKLDEDTYSSYIILQQLSRRSRYLLNENFKKDNHNGDILPSCITIDKHLRKSIHHLDIIMKYISKNYEVTFTKHEINCVELKGLKFENFIIVN
jgi:hypothetical protein